MKANIWNILFIILFVSNLSASTGSMHISQQKLPNENKQDEKNKKLRKDLEKYPVPSNAIELELKFSFPSEEMVKKEIYFYGADHMANDLNGNIFVSDPKAHRIFRFDFSGNFLSQIGRKGQGPGEFSWGPFEIMIAEDSLIVNGFGRVQFLDLKGNYIKGFKIFKTYKEMILSKEGLIFATPVLTRNQTTLVDVLSQDGELLYSFGEPKKYLSKMAQLNSAKIAFNDEGELFLAFRYFPLVRKYSKKGKLLQEFTIEHSYMKMLGKRNQDRVKKSSKGEQIGFAAVIAVMKATKDRLYILRTYPRIEILGFDWSGNQVEHYLKVQEIRDYFAWDFLILEEAGEKAFYILQFSPENRIDVFVPKNIKKEM